MLFATALFMHTVSRRKNDVSSRELIIRVRFLGRANNRPFFGRPRRQCIKAGRFVQYRTPKEQARVNGFRSNSSERVESGSAMPMERILGRAPVGRDYPLSSTFALLVGSVMLDSLVARSSVGWSLHVRRYPHLVAD
jgi:hypothetical protein